MHSNFCRDRKLLGHNRLFFSDSCHLVSCLSRHRNHCYDTYFLGQSKFFFNFGHDLILFCRDKILSFHSFYCRYIKLLCRDTGFAFNSGSCHNKNFFVAILLVLVFSFLSRQGIHLLHVLVVATEIIFVVTEILLLLVVNSKCYVAT